MQVNDTAYYLERAAAERKLAECSENAEVAAIHEELARQYEALVDHSDLHLPRRRRSPFSDRHVGLSRLLIL